MEAILLVRKKTNLIFDHGKLPIAFLDNHCIPLNSPAKMHMVLVPLAEEYQYVLREAKQKLHQSLWLISNHGEQYLKSFSLFC